MPPKDYYTKDGSAILGNMKCSIDDFAKFYASATMFNQLSNLQDAFLERTKKDEEDFNKLNKNYYSWYCYY